MMRPGSLFLLTLSLVLAGFLWTGFRSQPVVEAGSKTDSKAQGAALFADNGCAHCHGPAGFGGSETGPDLSQVRKQLSKEQIAKQIHDGGKNMPPFGDSLSQDQIAALVEYLHSKRKAPANVAAPAGAPASAPAAKSDPD
jgi:mono/diheme cytochrome c family protein